MTWGWSAVVVVGVVMVGDVIGFCEHGAAHAFTRKRPSLFVVLLLMDTHSGVV